MASRIEMLYAITQLQILQDDFIDCSELYGGNQTIEGRTMLDASNMVKSRINVLEDKVVRNGID